MELLQLAQSYFGDTRSGSLAGPLAGLFIAVLAVVTILLIRNMNARIRRLPSQFPEQPGRRGRQPRQRSARTVPPAADPTAPPGPGGPGDGAGSSPAG